MDTCKVNIQTRNGTRSIEGVISPNGGAYITATELRRPGGTLDQFRDAQSGRGKSRMLRRIQVHLFENRYAEKREMFSVSGRIQEFQPNDGGGTRQFITYGGGSRSQRSGTVFRDFEESAWLKDLMDQSVMHAVKQDTEGKTQITTNAELAQLLGQLSEKVDNEISNRPAPQQQPAQGEQQQSQEDGEGQSGSQILDQQPQ